MVSPAPCLRVLKEEFLLIAPYLLGGAETCLSASGSSQILGKTSSFEATNFAFEPSRKLNQFASQIAAAVSGACKVLQMAQFLLSYTCISSCPWAAHFGFAFRLNFVDY